MTERERAVLLAALDTEQERARRAVADAAAAARRATTAEHRLHELEAQFEQAHRLIAEQRDLIELLGGQPVKLSTP